MKHIVAIAISIVVSAASVIAFHEGHDDGGPADRTFKVSKTGEVNIGRDLKIRTGVVKRGKYMLTHRVEEDRHLFILTEIQEGKPLAQPATIELSSRFLPNSKRVKNSAVVAKEQRDHRSYALSNIQIAGENGDHVFNTSVGGNNANASNKN